MKYVLAIKEKDGNIKFYYDDNKYVMRLIEIDLDMCKEDEIPKADTDGGIIGRPLYFDECLGDWIIVTCNTPMKFPYRYEIYKNVTNLTLELLKDKNKRKIGIDSIIDFAHNRIRAVSLSQLDYNFLNLEELLK